MAVLVPEEEIPLTRNGTPLLGGLFSVLHKTDSDRLIFDRRPQNSTEILLSDWLDLPLGAQLIHRTLVPGQGIRASGDDLDCYFYYLLHEPGWWRENAVGRSLDGQQLYELWGKTRDSISMLLARGCHGRPLWGRPGAASS